MFNKHHIFIIIFGLLFIAATAITAQEKSSEKKNDHSSMQKGDVHKCMDKIASDEHMRGEMMTKMMDQMKVDSTSMMEMCKTMMDNPEMHSMMKNMMGNMDGKMMHDSTKKMNESTHNAHHKNDKEKTK